MEPPSDHPEPRPSPATLVERWPLTEGHHLRDRLLAAYAEPTRGYHDQRHLTEVLDRLDELAAAGVAFDRTTVELAAWFHDSVYDGERDAEERSATWAEIELPGLVDDATVAEVVRLVRLTETHDPEPDDLDGCALVDADLGILAADDTRYAEYVAAVRREFAHLEDDEFHEGRYAVLAHLLDAERLFHTAHGRQWEERARANAGAELTRLGRDLTVA